MNLPDRVREVYTQALTKCPDNKNLWLAAIHYEAAQRGKL